MAAISPASVTSKDFKKRLFLHQGQMQVFRDPARFKVVVAGRRWGKTQLARITIIKQAKFPNRLIWYVAPTYRMAKQIMWSELIDAIPREWIKKVNETSMDITLINGTKIGLRGADKPDTLRGVGLHYLVLDEFQDMKEEVWTEILRPTLASTGGHALFIGTPKAFNMLYKLYSLGQREDLRRIHAWNSWQFPTITSPFIPLSEIEQARRDMDPRSFRQEFEARFETMAGRVYYAFDRNVHVGRYPFDPKKPVWIGQDFNIDPMSSVIMQLQDNGELWIVGEIILYGSNTQEVCQELDRRFWRIPRNQIVIYPDPAGAYSQHARGETNMDIFLEHKFTRIKYRRKHPHVNDRINAVNAMLRSADGTIRMRVDESCKAVIHSLEQTIYKKGTPEVDKSLGVEHPADALGYCVEYEFPLRKFVPMGRSI